VLRVKAVGKLRGQTTAEVLHSKPPETGLQSVEFCVTLPPMRAASCVSLIWACVVAAAGSEARPFTVLI
jgi:hypothetical protein